MWSQVGSFIGVQTAQYSFVVEYFMSSHDLILSSWSTPKRKAIAAAGMSGKGVLPQGPKGTGLSSQPLLTWVMASSHSICALMAPECRDLVWKRCEFPFHISDTSGGGRLESSLGYTPVCSTSPTMGKPKNELFNPTVTAQVKAFHKVQERYSP